MCNRLLVLLMLVFVIVGVAAVEADPNLVAWYAFDDGSGTTASDSSGNNYDATVSSSSNWASDFSGYHLANCSAYGNLYVDVPNGVFSTVDEQITVSMWIWNPDADYAMGNLIKASAPSQSKDKILSMSIYDNGSTPASYYVVSAAGEDSSGNTDTQWWWGYNSRYSDDLEQWHHLAMVKDCDAEIEKLYYDGVQVANYTCDGDKTMAGIENCRIFTRVASGSNNWWDSYHGKIADVKIYDRALSAEEVADLATKDYAWNPDPSDGEDVGACLCEEVTLTWESGRYAASHDVYFGTDYSDVEDANNNSSEYVGNQQENYFETSNITANTVYYWRVDEVNDGNTWTGEVWSYCPNDLETVYYVDADDGNDLDDGLSTSTAWQSLTKVNATAFRSCETILFKADCQWSGQLALNGSGTENGYIQVDAYGTIVDDSNKPRIDAGGSYSSTLLIDEVEYWDVNNLQLTNYGATAGDWRKAVSISASDYGTMDYVHLQNLYVHSVNSTAGTGGGISWFCSSSGGPSTKFDDILIEDCVIENLGSWAIQGGNSHIGRIETATDPDNTKDFYPSTNVVIRGNRISNIDSSGIVIIGTDGCIVEDNVIDRTMTTAQGGCAIWPWSADNTIIQYNEVYDVCDNGDGESYDSDYNCRGSIFQYNYSHDNPGGFMRVCNGGDSTEGITGNFDTIIRYNVSVNDGSSTDAIFPTWKRCDNVKIYNNVIYSPSATVPLVDTSASGGTGAIWYWWNNIFYSNGTLRYDITDGSTNYWDYNCFYGTHQIKPSWWWVNGTPTDSNKITSDPNFVNTSTLDGFKIQSDSPCKDAGRTVTSNGDYDFWGNDLYNGDPDIGAHERP